VNPNERGMQLQEVPLVQRLMISAQLVEISAKMYINITHRFIDGPTNVEVPICVEHRREGKVQEALRWSQQQQHNEFLEVR